MHGLLIVDKPSGPTSFDVVRRVSRALGVKRAGHTGTLDPLASGVLGVCIGEATKLVQWLTASDKRYRAVARLGIETDTLDAAGKVVRVREIPVLTDEAIDAALAPLRGRIGQRPPAYSAIHVDGERAFDRARRGEAVELPVRDVEVFTLDVISRTPEEITLDVVCSKGTYVRSLVADLGQALGCGAHLAALRRERVGPFGLDRALTLEAVEADPEAARTALLTPAEALVALPSVIVTEPDVLKIRQGQPVGESSFVRADPSGEGEPLRCLDEAGGLVAVAARRGNAIRPLRVLV